MKKINNDNEQLFSKLVKAPSAYSYESLMKLHQERSKLQQKIQRYDKDGVRKDNALQRKVNKMMRLSTSKLAFSSSKLDSAKRNQSPPTIVEPTKAEYEEFITKYATQNEPEVVQTH